MRFPVGRPRRLALRGPVAVGQSRRGAAVSGDRPEMARDGRLGDVPGVVVDVEAVVFLVDLFLVRRLIGGEENEGASVGAPSERLDARLRRGKRFRIAAAERDDGQLALARAGRFGIVAVRRGDEGQPIAGRRPARRRGAIGVSRHGRLPARGDVDENDPAAALIRVEVLFAHDERDRLPVGRDPRIGERDLLAQRLEVERGQDGGADRRGRAEEKKRARCSCVGKTSSFQPPVEPGQPRSVHRLAADGIAREVAGTRKRYEADRRAVRLQRAIERVGLA